jgi:hypothetical protein
MVLFPFSSPWTDDDWLTSSFGDRHDRLLMDVIEHHKKVARVQQFVQVPW